MQRTILVSSGAYYIYWCMTRNFGFTWSWRSIAQCTSAEVDRICSAYQLRLTVTKVARLVGDFARYNSNNLKDTNIKTLRQVFCSYGHCCLSCAIGSIAYHLISTKMLNLLQCIYARANSLVLVRSSGAMHRFRMWTEWFECIGDQQTECKSFYPYELFQT